MRKRVLSLAICFVASLTIVAAIAWLSTYKIHKHNAFLRSLPSHRIFGKAFVNLKYNSWYIVGSGDNCFYLANSFDPLAIMCLQISQMRDSIFRLKIKDSIRLFKQSRVSIDKQSGISLYDGITPAIYHANPNGSLGKLSINPIYFTASASISDHSFVYRSVFNGKSELVTQETGKPFQIKWGLLKKQGSEGLFSTDGRLIKAGNNRIVYVYYYHNEFIVADTSLRLLYHGKTIDTISHSQLKVAFIPSIHQYTLAAPPIFVNKRAAANEKYLFIESALKSNNETDDMHREESPIDIYRLSDGKYLFSLEIPDFNGFKLRDFQVQGQTMLALFGPYAYKFNLEF